MSGTKQVKITCPICGHLTSDYSVNCNLGTITDIKCSNEEKCFFSSNYVPFNQWVHLLKLRASRDKLFIESTNKSMEIHTLKKQVEELENKLSHDKLVDIISEQLKLHELYSCSRSWEAWQYGTMTIEDFSLAGEDNDIVIDIVDEITSIPETH